MSQGTPAKQDRVERHLMRQRGAGARDIKADFGFAFAFTKPNLEPTPASEEPPTKRRKTIVHDELIDEKTHEQPAAPKQQAAAQTDQRTAKRGGKSRKRIEIQDDATSTRQGAVEEDRFVPGLASRQSGLKPKKLGIALVETQATQDAPPKKRAVGRGKARKPQTVTEALENSEETVKKSVGRKGVAKVKVTEVVVEEKVEQPATAGRPKRRAAASAATKVADGLIEEAASIDKRRRDPDLEKNTVRGRKRKIEETATPLEDAPPKNAPIEPISAASADDKPRTKTTNGRARGRKVKEVSQAVEGACNDEPPEVDRTAAKEASRQPRAGKGRRAKQEEKLPSAAQGCASVKQGTREKKDRTVDEVAEGEPQEVPCTAGAVSEQCLEPEAESTLPKQKPAACGKKANAATSKGRTKRTKQPMPLKDEQPAVPDIEPPGEAIEPAQQQSMHPTPEEQTFGDTQEESQAKHEDKASQSPPRAKKKPAIKKTKPKQPLQREPSALEAPLRSPLKETTSNPIVRSASPEKPATDAKQAPKHPLITKKQLPSQPTDIHQISNPSPPPAPTQHRTYHHVSVSQPEEDVDWLFAPQPPKRGVRDVPGKAGKTSRPAAAQRSNVAEIDLDDLLSNIATFAQAPSGASEGRALFADGGKAGRGGAGRRKGR